ncbi:MAG: excinuclease ABC subunit UvrC [Bacteroidota bacterium]
MENSLQDILKTLPDNPGVYQYFDKTGTIIYIGKAKNLKKRVLSYFNKPNPENGKLMVMVKKIADIKFIVVETEMDALLLENNLIKKYLPRYNILLKDDKTFPWICIKNERFPRVIFTRNFIKDGSQYFGPYTSLKLLNILMELIKKLYPLRNCNFNLSHENITKYKFKVCLEYHLGNCKGACEGHQTEEDYLESINQIKDILKGNISNVISHLKLLMKGYSENLEFEKAYLVKEKIDIIEKYQAKSTIVSATINDVDVFSIVSDEDSAFVNFLKVMNGSVVQAHTLEIKKKLDETDEELLAFAIVDLRQRFKSTSREVIVPFKIDIPKLHLTIPKLGDKKKLIELSERNAKFFKFEANKAKIEFDEKKKTGTLAILERMQKDLRMPVLPKHIECFDNSNIQGEYPVAAMVVFKDAKPSKNDYRHFNIKTVVGPDDYATMEEVVYRRYKRLLEENQALPQLILIDGGKGQLSSALKSLEKLDLRGKITIIGIAKKLEELYYPNDKYPLHLDKKSNTLKIIQQLRDEAHRFGITHHRARRSNDFIKSELDQIAGIGPKTKELLLTELKTIQKIKETSVVELTKIVGKAKAKIVIDFFYKKTLNQ